VVPEGAQGILLTTVDAHTLTDGPTIFLAEEIEKIGKHFITDHESKSDGKSEISLAHIKEAK
jgi:hypothetical protein